MTMKTTYLLGEPIDTSTVPEQIPRLIYFSYRHSFPPLPNSTLTTDVGWGCTIRCAQMLWANCLLRQRFPTWSDTMDFATVEYRKILTQFYDTVDHPCSIHQFCRHYPRFNKQVGDWVGPATVCDILASLTTSYAESHHIQHVSARDGLISLPPSLEPDHSYLITIPVRMGLERISPEYGRNLLALTRLSSCVGVIGGRDHQSYYLIGTQENRLLYLDPHHSQGGSPGTYTLESFETDQVGSLSVSDLAPTIAIGFYVTKPTQLRTLRHLGEVWPEPKFPLFTVTEGPTLSDTRIDSESDDEWNVLTRLE